MNRILLIEASSIHYFEGKNMLRRIFVVVFVFFIVAGEPTFGARLLGRRRACCVSHPACKNSSCGRSFSPDERFCIEDMIWDAPGPAIGPDLYGGQHWPDGCGDPVNVEHYSGTWFGVPDTDSSEFPETCPDDNCEHLVRGYGKTPVPHHGDSTLTTWQKAKDKIDSGLRVANRGNHKYIKIPKYKISKTATDDVYAIGVKITPQSNPSPAGEMWLCFQTEKLNPSDKAVDWELNHANAERAIPSEAGGQMIRVNFHDGSKDRVLNVWLK